MTNTTPHHDRAALDQPTGKMPPVWQRLGQVLADRIARPDLTGPRLSTWTLPLMLALVLIGCGGGGGNGTEVCQVGVSTMQFPNGCPVDNGGAGSTTSTPTISLTVTGQVSPEAAGSLQALVKDSAGAAKPGVAVTFTTSDKTGAFVPASGTALTDGSGVATIVLPAGTQAGAFTVTASATVEGTATKGTLDYAVTFPTLTLGPLAIAPAALSAGGTASLAVTVLKGTETFKPAQSVSFSSPCAAAGKATISTPVVTVNGVASTSYVDKGCGGADTITASTSFGSSNASQTGTLSIVSAAAGQIVFVSALPQNISLKGTGGAGRQESATVTFKVLDKNGNPVAGQAVDFALTSYAGGLTRNPVAATTGADGTASTVVAAGTVNTTVRVMASLASSITTLSDQLVVSTGVPDQNSFSLSTKTFNVEGMNHDGCEDPVGSTIRISLADHFNNPAPDGTAVSFTAEGGTVDASCLTGLVNTTLTDGTVVTQKGIPGQCTVRFCPASPRPADGRITVLAYAQGEESFVDTNGNNLFEAGEAFQDLGEPFRNDRAVTDRNANANWGVVGTTLDPVNPDDLWATGNAARAAGEIFIDSDASGAWTSTGDGQYNGVLKLPQSPSNPVTHVRQALVQVLSTSAANITALDSVPLNLSHCVDGTPFANLPKTLTLAIRDGNPTVFAGNKAGVAPLFLPMDLPGNILPAGTVIEFSASNGKILSGSSFTVPNTNEPSAAAWLYAVSIQSDATQSGPGTTSGGVTEPGYVCTNPVTSGLLTVKTTTPLGLITTRSYSIND